MCEKLSTHCFEFPSWWDGAETNRGKVFAFVAFGFGNRESIEPT